MTTTEDNVIEKELIKVIVELKNGKTLWGSLFCTKSERLQDVVNDTRQFIPLYKLKENAKQQNDHKLIILSKDLIGSLEEI